MAKQKKHWILLRNNNNAITNYRNADHSGLRFLLSKEKKPEVSDTTQDALR